LGGGGVRLRRKSHRGFVRNKFDDSLCGIAKRKKLGPALGKGEEKRKVELRSFTGSRKKLGVRKKTRNRGRKEPKFKKKFARGKRNYLGGKGSRRTSKPGGAQTGGG